jgi:hypothetical protein
LITQKNAAEKIEQCTPLETLPDGAFFASAHFSDDPFCKRESRLAYIPQRRFRSDTEVT